MTHAPWRPARPARRLLAGLATAGLLLSAATVASASTSPAPTSAAAPYSAATPGGARTGVQATGARATGARAAGTGGGHLLLALGDSLAAGYQPTDGYRPPPVDPATGLPDAGYPGGYAADLAQRAHLRLVDLGCPGETTASFTGRPAQAACRRAYEAMTHTSNQLDAALAELAAHRGQVALATFDLGANDVDACVHGTTLDTACLARVPLTLADRLPAILARLRSALRADDPGARLVAMTYYDPFLALADHPGGWRGDLLAAGSLGGLRAVNAALTALYRHAGALVAHVASAFSTGAVLPLERYRGHTLPKDVATICRLTWMCTTTAPGSLAGNVHPTTAGYTSIAAAFARALSLPPAGSTAR